MSNLTLNELVILGNEVKYSLNTAVAVEGDYTDLKYRKRAFRKLGAWMYEVKCSEEAGVITTSEAIGTLFTPMMLANKKTILEFRESGIVPSIPVAPVVVDQSAEVAELRAELAAALNKVESLTNTNNKLAAQLETVKASVRNLVHNNVVTKAFVSLAAK